MTTPERHQLAVARKTLTYSDVGARIMGGPTKAEAVDIIVRLTGRHPMCLLCHTPEPDCDCSRADTLTGA